MKRVTNLLKASMGLTSAVCCVALFQNCAPMQAADVGFQISSVADTSANTSTGPSAGASGNESGGSQLPSPAKSGNNDGTASGQVVTTPANPPTSGTPPVTTTPVNPPTSGTPPVTTTPVNPPTPPAPPMVCQDGSEYQASSNSCVSCRAQGKEFSVSQRACVSQCVGGLVIRMVNFRSGDTSGNPFAYNFDKGFKFEQNGVVTVIGNAVGEAASSAFYLGLQDAARNQTGAAGIVAAFAAGIAEKKLQLKATMGGTFSIVVQVNNNLIDIYQQEVVLSGSGTFKGLSWSLSNDPIPGGRTSREILCK